MSVRRNPIPVESMDAMPYHCVRCGRALKFEDRTVGFDPGDGHPILAGYGYCTGGWIDRLLGTDELHDRYIVSRRPAPPPMPAEPGSVMLGRSR